MFRNRDVCAALLALFLATPALAAPQAFETDLDPAPFDVTNQANVVGSGQIDATLDGHTISVSGNFSGLSSSATAAQVRMGLAMGVLGDSIATLTVTHATSGTVTGKAALNAAQLAALKAGALYIRIDSEKAPDGSLQGWLQVKGE
jgi:CHRD domain